MLACFVCVCVCVSLNVLKNCPVTGSYDRGVSPTWAVS